MRSSSQSHGLHQQHHMLHVGFVLEFFEPDPRNVYLHMPSRKLLYGLLTSLCSRGETSTSSGVLSIGCVQAGVQDTKPSDCTSDLACLARVRLHLVFTESHVAKPPKTTMLAEPFHMSSYWRTTSCRASSTQRDIVVELHHANKSYHVDLSGRPFQELRPCDAVVLQHGGGSRKERNHPGMKDMSRRVHSGL